MGDVLLLHGIPGSASAWAQVAVQLEPQHRMVAPDLLGFGGRPVPVGVDSLLAPSQARHVLGVLDEAGIDRFALVGHDFGGPIAAHLVAMVPERVTALALFATNAFPDTPIPFPLSALRLPLVGSVVERLMFSKWSLGMMVRMGVGRPRVRLDRKRYLGDAQQVSSIATIFAASLRRIEELYTPVEEALRAVGVPALVGWGDRDPFFSVDVGRRTAEAIPGAEFVLYEGAGHFLPEERPDEIAGDLLRLLG